MVPLTNNIDSDINITSTLVSKHDSLKPLNFSSSCQVIVKLFHSPNLPCTVTGRMKSNMVAAKPEELSDQLVDSLAAEFQYPQL